MSDQSLEGELRAAVDAWRQRHGLREDDPVFLLVELLQLHQHHWEARRQQRDEQAGSARMVASAGQGDSVSAPSEPPVVPASASLPSPGVRPWVAALAVLLAALGGFFLGRAW